MVVVFLWSAHFVTILNAWASHLTDILIFLKCHPFIPLDSIFREAARGTFQISELYFITSCIKTNWWPLIIRTMNSKILSLAWISTVWLLFLLGPPYTDCSAHIDNFWFLKMINFFLQSLAMLTGCFPDNLSFNLQMFFRSQPKYQFQAEPLQLHIQT